MNANPSMTLLDLLVVIRRRGLLVAVVAAACVAIAIFYTKVTPRLFESRVVATPSEWAAESGQRSAIPGLNALQRLSGSADSSANELLAILQSRNFVEEFITRNGLLPEIFAERWDDQAGKWIGDIPPLESAARVFTRSIRSVSLDSETGFLIISVRWTDGALAKLWAETTVSDLNEWMSRKATLETERDLAFLRQQLESTSSTEVRQGLATLIKERTEKRMLAAGRTDYALRVIDPAMQSGLPVWPRPLLIFAGSLCIGVLLGAAMAFLLEMFALMRRRRP